ncbi:MAG: U2 snRNP complex subunit msl1 [Bathelium mastoideum]|nr:MAG: U2 snRNP complex subunit msl1 [Bathelium mastoideum]KAI9686654.1 MAG: U2 snRNP complex subunit msl1 [Bathelium mastoideum]
MASRVKAAPPSYPPNRTLYCKNLPDKMQKEDLRRALYALFSTYGPVLDIVALKTPNMRGQAHVVFRDIQASGYAKQALNNFNFFGKDMKIEYAKGKSNTIAKLDGTFKMPETGAANVATSEVQQSIFDAPPSAAQKPAAAATTSIAPNGIPPKPSLAPNGTKEPVDVPSPQGVKRRREEEEESEESDVPMEEDDEGEEMEVSDED